MILHEGKVEFLDAVLLNSVKKGFLNPCCVGGENFFGVHLFVFTSIVIERFGFPLAHVVDAPSGHEGFPRASQVPI